MKQNHCTIKYRSLTYIYLMRSIFVSHWSNIPTMMIINQIILKIFISPSLQRKCLGSLFHYTRSVSDFLLWIPKYEKEPQHDKTNKMSCAPKEDLDQAGHPPCLIRVFAVRMKKPWDPSYPMSGQRRLWSECPVWSESSLDTQVILLVLLCGSSYHNHLNVQNSV